MYQALFQALRGPSSGKTCKKVPAHVDLQSTRMGEGQGSKFITKEPKNYGEKQSGAGGERAPWLRILKGSK